MAMKPHQHARGDGVLALHAAVPTPEAFHGCPEAPPALCWIRVASERVGIPDCEDPLPYGARPSAHHGLE
eukprot:957786-Lingulodinium_polyedra.AAC.1